MIGPRRHPPGTPCLSALRTTDVAASVDFYRALFGWTPVPAAPNGFVIMMRDDLPVAGVGPVFDPAHDVRWCTYLAAPAVDRTARAVVAAGGTVEIEPFDVPGIARVGIAADPGGAEFWLWQPYAFVGAEVAGVADAVSGRVLATPDPATARRFYADVFGWSSGARDFRLGEEVVGELAAAETDTATWTPLFAVGDLTAAAASARGLGAVVGSTTDRADRCLIRDPQGAELLLDDIRWI